MKIKKILLFLLVSAFMFLISSCTDNKDNKIHIVSTIFPIYDWTSNIIKDVNDNIELDLLVNNGTDVHNYQPTADDIIKITTCDMLILVGGESDSWILDALTQKKNQDMVIINLMDILGEYAREEEAGLDDEEETDEVEYDEHIWLSLKYASFCVAIITAHINELDKDNEAKYNTNCNNYAEKLFRLDQMYQNNLSNTRFNTLVFGDRFPFLYLVKDYDINYYAAFNGCSAEAEASFKTITKLASIVDELGLRYVIKLEGSNNRIAETVVEATQDKNQKILILDSMQSKTLKDLSNGITYLSIMEDNLEVLIKALN